MRERPPTLTLQIRAAILAGAALAAGAPALAQGSELMRFDSHPYGVSSGTHTEPPPADWTRSEAEGSEPALATRYWTVVRSPGVNLIRVHFGAYDLGTLSEVRLTSLADNASQRFTQSTLEAWDGWSAIFNGDAVLVQLLVAPGETAQFAIDEIAVNDPPVQVLDGGIATLCGLDNRVASGDSRVGRLSGPNCGSGGGCGGCTAWLTSIGCALTAGHCGTASGGLIEFNVPASSASGNPVAANPDDQYPVGTTFYAFQDGGLGFDWAIMSVGPNANTGLLAHWVQGYFHLTPVLPGDGATMRVTGCGVDNSPAGASPNTCCAWDGNGNCTHMGCNSASLTLQTSTGSKTGDTANRLFYAVDTEPANSGSPVIRTATDFAVAIHTNGGCTAGGGENSGTRLTQSVLWDWLNIFLGDNVVFVDYADVSSVELGDALTPSPTVMLGASLAPSGGTVAIAGGNYGAASGNTGTITKAITLRAASGVVTIGN